MARKIRVEEKGLNPRIGICERCGEDIGVALLGEDEWVKECLSCGERHLVSEHKLTCPSCKGTLKTIRYFGEHEKLPIGLCDECKEEVERFRKIVEAGGVYWRCTAGHKGVIKADTDVAKELRKKLGIEPPEPCGVEITEEQCPACRGEFDE